MSKYYVRNPEKIWEWLEVSQAEAYSQSDVVSWEYDEDEDAFFALYAGDFQF